ncbi:MAG TPA: hypothetical protein VM778_12965, partial [Gemmatimonadota bacterium]|nr:hypothetical protein [Gemmatimonadota bacterium]
PIREDEAAMYDSVASSWVPLWLAAGISTNNQPGHSALVWAGHFLWGDSVAGMRLFSPVFWGLSVVVAGRLHAALVGRRSLALVALVFALPPVLTQGILARGHILTVFLVLLAALVAARSEGTGDAVRAGVVTGFALWVVPTAILALPVLLAVVAWRARDRRDGAARALGVLASIPVAALLYLPMHLGTGLGALRTAQMAADEPDLPSGTAWLAQMGGPDGLFHAWYVPPLLALGAFAAATRGGRLWLLALPLLVPLVAALLEPSPLPYSLLFLAPLLVLTWSAVRRPWQRYAYGVLAVAAAGRIAFSGTGWLDPKVAGAADSAREAARLLVDRPPAVVQTATHDSEYHVLRFYLRSYGWAGRVEVADSLTGPWVYEVNMPERVGPGLRPTGIEGLYRE